MLNVAHQSRGEYAPDYQSFFKRVKQAMALFNNESNLIDKVFEWAGVSYRAARGKNSSLAKFTSVSRVEPICVVDSDCINLEYISDVISTATTVFTGYYLQAIALLTTVQGVAVIRELERLNPKRDANVAQFVTDVAVSQVDKLMGNESYTYKLPKVTDYAVEATIEDIKNKVFGSSDTQGGLNSVTAQSSVKAGKDLLSLQDYTNLSTGNLVNVTIKKENKEAVIPIAIRLIVNMLASNTVVKLLGDNILEKSLTERWYKWRAGRISFFKDLLLCQDLIKAHKKELMEDSSGVLSEISKRASSSLGAGITTKNASVATASNIFIISSDTAEAIKRSSGADIEVFNQRQKLFEQTYALLFIVIDRDYQRINIYHDGVALPSNVGVKDIKNASKKDTGGTVMDVLNAYRQGAAPTL